MPKFKDTKQREWHIDVTVASIKCVRDLVGFDLCKILDGEGDALKDLLVDHVKLCDVLYAQCKPQCDALAPPAPAVDDVAFGEALAGDALFEAGQAFVDALIAFCPSPSRRKNLKSVMDAIRKAMDRAEALSSQQIESGRLDRIIDETLSKAFGELASNSPASPALSPGV